MFVFDTHCDVLLKLWERRDRSFVVEDPDVQVSLPEWNKGNLLLQVCAIFTPYTVPAGSRFHAVLEMIDLFEQQVVAAGIQPVRTQSELRDCVLNGKKGAILFVEGAEAILDSLSYLRALYRMGVRGMGLTWNVRNAVADGCMEPRPGGLSAFGRDVVAEMNRLGMVIDVTHLAEPGFWDVMELSQAPVIASHSNAKHVFDHPRNLTDDQVRALVAKDGFIGLNLYPGFYREKPEEATICDVLRHVEHICALGGAKHLGFGADFDGIDATLPGLASAGTYPVLIEELLKHYKEQDVKNFMADNGLRVFGNVLK